MPWAPPANWVEVQAQLKKSGSVTLDATGNGTVTFDPDSAHQRWLVTSIVVSTNQSALAVCVPVATVMMNTSSFPLLSPGNNRGASWSGNQDTFSGSLDVGPCDFLGISWSPPPGATAAQITALHGVIATAIITGIKYTRIA